MGDIQIEVSAYAGYKGEEYPRAFFVDGEKITVMELLKIWIEEDGRTRKRKRFYLLKGSDGTNHKLFYDLFDLKWYYRSLEKDHHDKS